MASVILYLCMMTVPALVGALVWLVFYPLRKHIDRVTGRQPGRCYESALLVWFMFLACLLGLTLTPSGFWQSVLTGQRPVFPPAFRGGINLKPFHASWALLQFYAEHGLWGTILINFPGNVLMFAPVGFFTALFSSEPRWWKSTLWTAGLSLFIEFSQLFISRGTDIDDLILNTLGGALGYAIYFCLSKKFPHWVKCCSPY